VDGAALSRPLRGSGGRVSLRLLSYNIRYGGVGREKALARVIASAEPELVVLEEATRPEVVRSLAESCGMPVWGAHLGESVAFLSRTPVASFEWQRVALAKRRYLEIVLGDGRTRIFGVHLSAIHSNVTERRRTVEVHGMLRQTVAARSHFHCFAGDFNTVAAADPFDIRALPMRLRALLWIGGGPIRWTAHAAMLAAGYADAYRLLHTDSGHTFPTWEPHVRLDYVFVPASASNAVRRCEVMREAPGVREASDHFPLLAEIEIPSE
jgi:endonuclease/exonuclease/phosphatase family metal-dependent hydrolase